MAVPPTIQRFRVLDQIGAGGMGTVYRAHDPQLERDVAIKVLSAPGEPVKAELATVKTIDLRADVAARPSSEDLLREARMMARLSHPNVVPVYEVGLDGASVFVVMEHVDGADLRSWLAARPRSTQDILAAFAQAGQGLAAAHARGIVHRDFKPDNVLIGSDGRARVADFGLSRLNAPGASMLVRVAETSGTPAYMAPELWDGAPATAASDVYAFCVALVEALGIDGTERAELARRLRERGVAAPARELIVAGTADQAAARPDIAQLVAAFAAKGPRRRWIALGAGAVALAATGIAVLSLGGESREACTIDRAVLANRWDAAVQRDLRARFPGTPDARWEALVSGVGAQVDAVLEHQREACRAVQRRELTAEQGAKRNSCLERRLIAVGARARFSVTAKQTDVDSVEELLREAADSSPCPELDAPPLHPDRARVAAVHLRAVAWVDFGEAEAIEELRRIEVAAGEIDELELQAHTAIKLGMRLRNNDKLTEASDAFQRAHKQAITMRSASLAALALLERSSIAARRGDANAARSLAELAIEQAEKPTATWRNRVRAYRALSWAQVLRAEYREVIETCDKALALIAKHGRYGEFEVILRMDKINAFNFLNDRDQEALAYAKETVARAKELVGTKNLNYAVALDLLARSYQNAEQPAETPRYRRESLRVLQELYPPDHSRVVAVRAELGNDLMYNNELAAARAELAATVQIAREKPALRSKLAYLSGRLAVATFEGGDHAEGVRLAIDAIDQLTSQQGLAHPQTAWFRFALAEMYLELGQLDDAERAFSALEAAYRQTSLPDDRRPAWLLGLRASVLLERGRSEDAEQLARDALARLVAVGASPLDQRGPQGALIDALLEQHRDAAALELARSMLTTVRAGNTRADEVAVWELRVARAELATGARAEAIARAERARDELARWPGQIRARRTVAALLAKARSPVSGRKP